MFCDFLLQTQVLMANAGFLLDFPLGYPTKKKFTIENDRKNPGKDIGYRIERKQSNNSAVKTINID